MVPRRVRRTNKVGWGEGVRGSEFKRVQIFRRTKTVEVVDVSKKESGTLRPDVLGHGLLECKDLDSTSSTRGKTESLPW